MPCCCSFCCAFANFASVDASFCTCSKLFCTGCLAFTSSTMCWTSGPKNLAASFCLLGTGPLCVASATRSRSMF